MAAVSMTAQPAMVGVINKAASEIMFPHLSSRTTVQAWIPPSRLDACAIQRTTELLKNKSKWGTSNEVKGMIRTFS